MFDRALDILFPPRCPGCNQALPLQQAALRPRQAFCRVCRVRITPWDDACPTCAVPHLHYLDEPRRSGPCDACRAEAPPWDWAVCGFEMAGPAREAVHRAKSPGGEWVMHAVAIEVERHLPETDAPLFVPVPLHPAAMAKRGFNQARELARALAASTDRDVLDLLMRIKRGVPQKTLGRAARAENVAGAFAVRECAKRPAAVILVDDVMTTGATAMACAAALVTAGVAVAGVATLCREV